MIAASSLVLPSRSTAASSGPGCDEVVCYEDCFEAIVNTDCFGCVGMLPQCEISWACFGDPGLPVAGYCANES
jgi:hypothetical protein